MFNAISDLLGFAFILIFQAFHTMKLLDWLSLFLSSFQSKTVVMIPLGTNLAFNHISLSFIWLFANTKNPTIWIFKISTFFYLSLLLFFFLSSCIRFLLSNFRIIQWIEAAVACQKSFHKGFKPLVVIHNFIETVKIVLSFQRIGNSIPKLIIPAYQFSHGSGWGLLSVGNSVSGILTLFLTILSSIQRVSHWNFFQVNYELCTLLNLLRDNLNEIVIANFGRVFLFLPFYRWSWNRRVILGCILLLIHLLQFLVQRCWSQDIFV